MTIKIKIPPMILTKTYDLIRPNQKRILTRAISFMTSIKVVHLDIRRYSFKFYNKTEHNREFSSQLLKPFFQLLPVQLMISEHLSIWSYQWAAGDLWFYFPLKKAPVSRWIMCYHPKPETISDGHWCSSTWPHQRSCHSDLLHVTGEWPVHSKPSSRKSARNL